MTHREPQARREKPRQPPAPETPGTHEPGPDFVRPVPDPAMSLAARASFDKFWDQRELEHLQAVNRAKRLADNARIAQECASKNHEQTLDALERAGGHPLPGRKELDIPVKRGEVGKPQPGAHDRQKKALKAEHALELEWRAARRAVTAAEKLLAEHDEHSILSKEQLIAMVRVAQDRLDDTTPPPEPAPAPPSARKLRSAANKAAWAAGRAVREAGAEYREHL